MLITGTAHAEDLQKLIQQNTFIFVPINHYAQNISKDRADQFVKNNCHMSNLPPSEILNCQALSQCSQSDCRREYGTHGTAFLAGDGSSLHTAWHVAFPTHAAALVFIKNYVLKLTDEERDELFKVLNPNFLLLDHDLNIVYDSRLEPETKYLKFGNPLSTVFIQDGRVRDQAYGYFENIPQDHVSIKLGRSLGQGLKVNQSEKTDLNQIFITAGFGYDSVNFNFSVDQGQPHNLLDLKASSGRYMSFLLTPMTLSHEDFLKHTLVEQLVFMGYSEENSISQIEQHGDELIANSIRTVLHAHARHERDRLIESHDHVLFLTNPVFSGQSGGPVLNTKGEVLGIITN